MKYILVHVFCAFTLSLSAQVTAPSQLILRSTLSSASTNAANVQHIFQQSTGQASISGTYTSADYSIHQGFVQPSAWQNMALSGAVIDLKGYAYPNPFVSEVTISFNEQIYEPVRISIHDEMGRKLQSEMHPPAQEIQLNLEALTAGKYYLKIEHNKRFLIHQLVKFK